MRKLMRDSCQPYIVPRDLKLAQEHEWPNLIHSTMVIEVKKITESLLDNNLQAITEDLANLWELLEIYSRRFNLGSKLKMHRLRTEKYPLGSSLTSLSDEILKIINDSSLFEKTPSYAQLDKIIFCYQELCRVLEIDILEVKKIKKQKLAELGGFALGLVYCLQE